MKRPVYLDHHATTPVDPAVFEAMRPYFMEAFGNASSRQHAFGWAAQEAVDRAREQVAELVGAAPGEIIFTSGATESNNLAIKGAAAAYADPRDHIVTLATEHSSVLNSCRRLRQDGFQVTILPVQANGLVDLTELRRAITSRTILVSVLHANNEIGVLQPIEEIARLAHSQGALFHTDAVQSAGKVPLDLAAAGVDLASISAHKFYGPKGVGALYVRQRDTPVRLETQLDGGGQERGRRSGSLNVPGIVGLGEACAIARRSLVAEQTRLAELRDALQDQLCGALDGLFIHGADAPRLPHNLSVSFADVDGEHLFDALHDVAVSSGSACGEASRRPSHVLQAIGVRDELCHATLRFGLGRFTTAEEVDFAGQRVIEVVTHLRAARMERSRQGAG